MKVIIAGGGDVGRLTAENFINLGHEVTLIERDKEVCTKLAESFDAMILCGDATRPDMLEKAGVEGADIVIALTEKDQDNIIISLIAKQYGAKRCIVMLDDREFNAVCIKLGMEEIINPKAAAAAHIADMAKRRHAIEVSTLVGGALRAFTVDIKDEQAGKKIEEMGLPSASLAVVVERGEEFFLASPGFELIERDRLTVLCEEKVLDTIKKKFS
ncbi:MAG: NAD-binding protein [Deltaproteobacteria bacterium]|nr:NAD-binding protein [Deltaproteobacteria bacterium]